MSSTSTALVHLSVSHFHTHCVYVCVLSFCFFSVFGLIWFVLDWKTICHSIYVRVSTLVIIIIIIIYVCVRVCSFYFCCSRFTRYFLCGHSYYSLQYYVLLSVRCIFLLHFLYIILLCFVLFRFMYELSLSTVFNSYVFVTCHLMLVLLFVFSLLLSIPLSRLKLFDGFYGELQIK